MVVTVMLLPPPLPDGLPGRPRSELQRILQVSKLLSKFGLVLKIISIAR